MTDALSPSDMAMLGHLELLREGAVNNGSAEDQLDCAILLIDLYEAILERNGILIFSQQERVVEH